MPYIKKAIYFLVLAVIFVTLTNEPMYIHQQQYECNGVIFDRFISETKIYDANGNLIETTLYQQPEGKEVEPESKSKILNHHAKISMIYLPLGFWSGLLRSFSTGLLRTYEATTDTYKNFRVDAGPSAFFLRDKEEERMGSWGNFDLLNNAAYIGLPNKDKDKGWLAFSGTCKRTF